MKKIYLISLLLIVCSIGSFAQFPANTYQTEKNKHYWKARKPYEGYWQQDVHYTIKAQLNDSTNIITASEKLVYTNNSPDSLPFVYFHLYSNAQAKGSYLADLYKNNGKKVFFGENQTKGLGCNISTISVNGKPLKTEQDNTILKVFLSTAIKAGESITFDIEFNTYFENGTIRNRMKMFDDWGYKHFDVVHWYPRISVYDRKFGWDTDQHLDREFYGNFGTFDVAFTLPKQYIVDATGTLLNPSEAMPDSLRAKIELKNFANKPWNEKPSEIIKPDGTTKTWKYHAENVHDFALTADPTYRIGETEWNGIKCIALVREPHASKWQNAAAYTRKVIEINSQDFGMYEYPKMIVADAEDGMEYPMLTLDGGQDPSYRSLLVHEISHNWFFGMVANNETYRAALDEGFTQFLTSWTYRKIDGDYPIKTPTESKYLNKHENPISVIDRRAYYGYMRSAVKDVETSINVHSDGYNGALRHGGGYGQVYYKTAVMLYNLQYTLGDSLFLSAINNYVHQWKFAHPYFEDFRNSVIQHTKVDLNWFFDQWIESSKTIDYKVKSVKKGTLPDEYEITFERIGMQMPIDFSVTSLDSTFHFHIPNNWFEKKTAATILPRWIGWDKIKPTYIAKVVIPGGIKNVQIDPTNRLADVNMLNNSFKLPIKYKFDSKVRNFPSWKEYEVNTRPEIWYNGYDGVKVGVHMNSHFMKYKHIVDATLWFNLGVAQQNIDTTTTNPLKHDFINYRLKYKTATDKFMQNSAVYAEAKALEGLNAYKVGFERTDRSKKNKLYMDFKSMYRHSVNDLGYLLLPTEWNAAQFNNTLNIGLAHKYRYSSGKGQLNIGLRSSAIGSDYDYQRLLLSAINKTRLGKLVLQTRIVGQYGTGTKWAKESSLFLAGANPEEMMENKYTRSQGFFAPSTATIGASTNTFHAGGGLNLRGYSGYLAPIQHNDSTIVYSYRGQSGAAINAELEFTDLMKIKKRSWLTNTFNLKSYLFGDAGVINYNIPNSDVFNLSNLKIDFGIGTALTIKKFGVLETVKPLTIRVDMPFFLNSLPANQSNNIASRFVFGINRAF